MPTLDKPKVLISEEEIKSKVKELGSIITRDYADKKLLLVAILKGSVIFLADLMREIDLDLSIDFMIVSSYGNGTESHGNIKIVKDLDQDLSDYDMLIVEDILDTGHTLSELSSIFKIRNVRSIKICTLLDKPSRRVADITADYTGFTVENKFIVGYGLDYSEKYRNLPYIGILGE